MKKYILAVMVILTTCFVRGEINLGINSLENPQVIITPTIPPINYSLVPTVNSSLYWGNYLWTLYDMPTIKLFAYNQTTPAISYVNNNFVPYTGATQNINIGGFNLTTIGQINTASLNITNNIRIGGTDYATFNGVTWGSSYGTFNYDSIAFINVGTMTASTSLTSTTSDYTIAVPVILYLDTPEVRINDDNVLSFGNTGTERLLYNDTGFFLIGGGTDAFIQNSNLDLYSDVYKMYFGSARQSSIGYNGTDLIINPKQTGTGKVQVSGEVDVSEILRARQGIFDPDHVAQDAGVGGQVIAGLISDDTHTFGMGYYVQNNPDVVGTGMIGAIGYVVPTGATNTGDQYGMQFQVIENAYTGYTDITDGFSASANVETGSSHAQVNGGEINLGLSGSTVQNGTILKLVLGTTPTATDILKGIEVPDVSVSNNVSYSILTWGGTVALKKDFSKLTFGNNENNFILGDDRKLFVAGNNSVEIIKSVPTNLSIGGDFATAGTWGYGTGWVYSTSLQRANKTAVGTGNLTRTSGCTIGKLYHYCYDVPYKTVGSVTFDACGFVDTAKSVVGTYCGYFEATTTQNITFKPAGTTTRIAIDNVYVEEYTPALLNTGDTNVSGNIIISGNFSAKRPYGMFSSTQTQTVAGTATATPVTFNITEDSWEIYKSSDNANFSFGLSGDYLIELSAVVSTTTGSNKHIEIWLRKNNVNIPRSNTKVEIATSGQEQVIAVPFIIDTNTTDQFTVMWASDTTNAQLLFTQNTSYSPSVPSIIMAITKASETAGIPYSGGGF